MSIALKLSVDAREALSELGAFSSRLDAMTSGFDKLNTVTTTFNKKGQQTTSVIKAQISQFESVTQVVNKAGKVIETTYEKNEAAARRFEASQRKQDEADARRAAAATQRYDKEVARRNAAIDKEIAKNEAAARRFEASQRKQDEADARRAAAATQRYDKEVARRNAAIDKEIANSEKAAKRKAEIDAKEKARMEGQTSFFSAQIGRLTRNFVQFVEFRGFHFITDQLLEGANAARDFQVQISLIRTISQDSQQSFGKFGRDIRGVSDSSGFDIKDVGKAFYDTTSNQVAKGANVAAFVQQATDLARVTGSDLPNSVNILSSVINSYNLSAADAEKVSATLFKTIDEGRIVTSELANTFGRVLVLGNNLGVSYQDLEAVLAITTQKGLKTSDAMTLLTNILIKLEKPTEATKAFFQSIGADTGEQAVAISGGFIPLVNKMVAAVKSGQVDVSAFFDEIRGRKQFGVFEQSGSEIEAFANKLKDTSSTLKQYKDAIAIRGESPADALNKEINKLSNVFKADFGQAIVKTLADLIAWSGGVDRAKDNAKEFGQVLSTGGKIFAGFAAVVIARNIAMAVSFRALGTAAAGALKFFIPFAAGYYAGKKLFGGAPEAQDVGIKEIEGTVEQLEKMRVAYEKLKASQQGQAFDPLASFKESSDNVNKAYKTVLELLAQASIVNDRFLDSVKVKSKEAADALKIGFGTYTDVFKEKINNIRKTITEARTEIERSQRSVLGFRESLDDILFRTKEKYANDDFGQQKIQLQLDRISALRAKKDQLFGEGTEESIAEGRKIYDEIAKREEDLFNLRIDYQKKQFQNYLDTNPVAANRPGANVFTVDPSSLERSLGALAAERAKDEERIVKAKKEQITTSEQAEVKEKTNLRQLEQAIKKYEDLEIFTKDGKLKGDFADKTGKFDRMKFEKSFQDAEKAIRAPGGASPEQRIALEQLLLAKRKSIIEEAGAFERSEDLKTTKTKVLNDKENVEKSIEGLKKNRDENLKIQNQILTSIGNKSFELAGFEEAIKAGSQGSEERRNRFQGRKLLSEEDIKKLEDAKARYQAAAKDVIDNPMVKEGIAIADPKKAQAAYDTFADALKTYDEVARKYRIEGGLPAFQAEGGQKIGGEASRRAFQEQLDDLRKSGGQLYSGVEEEAKQKDSFKKNVLEPVEKLKGAFPDLKVGAQDFSNAANESFRSLANGGVEDLRKKLEAVNKLLIPVAPAGPGKPAPDITGMIGDESGYAYAAKGGIAGLFPGQPRGKDRYPIWAAAGERIIDADTSAMYAPMLDAIMSRRMPQYMAGGGIVGGDTHVGDINVTVNGAKTNSDTARAIGQHLERQLRLNNIRLERKR